MLSTGTGLPRFLDLLLLLGLLAALTLALAFVLALLAALVLLFPHSGFARLIGHNNLLHWKPRPGGFQ